MYLLSLLDSTAYTSGPRNPDGDGIQADALAGPEDTTLRVKPETA